MTYEEIARSVQLPVEEVKALDTRNPPDLNSVKIFLKTNSGSFPNRKAALFMYRDYRFFARFLMSSAIEGLASNLVSAAAASASTALFSGMGCAV